MLTRTYGLNMSSHVQYVALSIEAAQAVSLDDMAAGYTPPIPTDLDRVRRHEGCTTDDAAKKKLLHMAIGEIETRGERGTIQLVEEDGKWRFADGVTFEKLRWLGKAIPRPGPDINEKLHDPFNPHNGAFAENIRALGREDPAELRESMREFGWIPELPALADERGAIIVGHRRLAVAKELGIAPVTRKIEFGFSDAADARRVKLALASNLGGKPLSKKDREKIAKHLYVDAEWTIKAIAEALNISEAQISAYLSGVPKTPRLNSVGNFRGNAHPCAASIAADLLNNSNVKIEALAEKYGVAWNTVKTIARRVRLSGTGKQTPYGSPIRPATKSELEARGLSPKSGRLIDTESGETISRTESIKRKAVAEALAPPQPSCDFPVAATPPQQAAEALDKLMKQFKSEAAIVAALTEAKYKILHQPEQQEQAK
jgi:hypothetical protein